jgi:hypothetical protein
MTFRVAVFVMVSVVACGPGPRPGGSGGPCTAGIQRCAGPELQQCLDGELVTVEVCPAVCDDALGCVVCEPAETVCLGQTSHACLGDGTGYVDDNCGDEAGELCSEDTGLCEKPCDPESLASSYLGCEYYPTITGNMLSNQFSFAVIIANYHGNDAVATIDGGGLAVAEQFAVPARSVVVRNLPWNEDLKLCNADAWEDCRYPTRFSARSDRGAFHLSTTLPVAVYQFNPLDYHRPELALFSYSNDASLLFPVNVWGTEIRVASWRESYGAPGLLTVTAGADATSVTITTTAATQGDATVASFVADAPQTLVLDRGDVVELGSIATGDLTGSLVTADKPVQVIGGHYCANVPFGVSYCDHLEESMIPVRALGDRYVVAAARNDQLANGRQQVVRVIATEPNTELALTPDQPGVNTTLQRAGDFLELANTDASFEILASEKVLVAQYMVGQTATAGTADPAMTIAVPTAQYRANYLFHAPTNYPQAYVDVIAPAGTVLSLDGAAVSAPAIAIAGTMWTLTRLTLDHGPAGDGNHELRGTAPLGVTVYGYGDYTSFWYPGGLDLQSIIE